MNQGTQTESFNSAIQAECKKYFYAQKENILSNIRVYARYDEEINFFLDKVLDELRMEFKREREIIRNDLKEEFNSWKVKYKDELKNGMIRLNSSLDEKSRDIFKKEPYDLLTRNFMLKLKQEWRNEYEDKINNIYFLISLIVLLFFGCYYFFKY